METRQIRKKIEKLTTGEIQENISETFYNEIEIRIAHDIINHRNENQNKENTDKNIKLTKRAIIAAWIAALSALASAIFALLTFLKA